jgi:hypothetical protein
MNPIAAIAANPKTASHLEVQHDRTMKFATIAVVCITITILVIVIVRAVNSSRSAPSPYGQYAYPPYPYYGQQPPPQQQQQQSGGMGLFSNPLFNPLVLLGGGGLPFFR